MNNLKIIENDSKPVLIFPGGMARSLEYLQNCLRDRRPVIGASSLDYDVSREKYPLWLYLPYITQPEFDEALKEAISKFGIGGIYSPNSVVWECLNRRLKDIAPGVSLVNESPLREELSGFRSSLAWARSRIEQPLPVLSVLAPKPHLPQTELASLFMHAELIPGMCDHEKFCALYEIARRSIPGDVVEIGSWWGKSAFILARLAICYGIGNLLCVDPWSNDHLVQNDAEGLVDRVSAQLDAEEAFMYFVINLLPYNSNHINYLRMPSTDGANFYRVHRNVNTESFGTTNYCGHISILHIDGNHSYASVKADIISWSGFVVNGGWIIIDDYIWPYGDGPQRAGDEFLLENQGSIVVSFVIGSALFIQLSV
jgi:cephalosporin hydroxylase